MLKDKLTWAHYLTILTLLGLLYLSVITLSPQDRYRRASVSFLPHKNTVATIKPGANSNRGSVPQYVLNSPSCRILDRNPFDSSRRRLGRRKEFQQCNNKHLLTSVSQLANGSFAISINKQFAVEYHNPARENLTCCYEVITRGRIVKNPDDTIIKSKCMKFKEKTILDKSVEFIIVTCHVKRSNKKTTQVYKDAHAILPVKPEVKIRLDEFRSKRAENKMDTPPSVLMFAIDSVSRLNFRRAMPQTLKHLQSTGWVELNAYNKVADVTFPNVMALLKGYNHSDSNDLCQPEMLGGLDNCSLIWNKFQNNGYVTAYVEDEAYMHTFNRPRKGFIKQPTDYYPRPYFMAMEEELTIKKRHTLRYCLGSITSAERIMNYMLDFTTTFKNNPYFGIFWTASLLHNSLDLPPSMDIKIKKSFVELSNRGVLNNSIVFFFSDHGLRVSYTKGLPTAESEFRLPFMFVWIPEKLRASHTALFANLVQNSNKLTTPYDIHMTLQHILSLFGNDTEQPSRGCPNCTSILKPIPFDRSCAEAGVNIHWCACESYKRLSTNDANVKAVAKFIVDHINKYIIKMTDSSEEDERITFQLKKIVYASVKENGATVPQSNRTSKLRVYHVRLQTLPEVSFESTVTVDEYNRFEIQGHVSIN